MGNTDSKLSSTDIRKCIASIEEEITSGEYDGGVTPDSVVMCLRTLCNAAERGGGNVIVPKAHGIVYERDVVVSCFPRTRSVHSVSMASTSTGYVRRRHTSGSTVSGAVETPARRVTSITPSEARKTRMAERAATRGSRADRYHEADPLPHPGRRRSGSAVARDSLPGAMGDTEAYIGPEVAAEMVRDQIASLNIQRHTSEREPEIFTGPPTQRSVRDRAKAMERR